MEIRDCRVLTPPPIGTLVSIRGDAASCGYCGEVVYSPLAMLADHDFSWDGFRVLWYSRPFATTVHACLAESATADKEILELTSA